MKKRRRFQEGGDIPDIDREPLRDSQGNIVRSGIDTFTERFNINRGISPSDKGEPVMSGSTRDRGYGEAVALGRRMREERDAAAMDEAMLRKPSQQKTTVAPVKPSTITSTSVAADLEEPESAGFSRTVTKTATKSPVVTKEQMKKAGFDNLRDYMNAQKGLTRRGEAAKPVAKPTKPESPSMSSFAPDARAGRSTNVRYLRKDRFGMEPDMYIARRRMKEGFKAGGKIGLASKRADGIASKGKTRGKII